MIQRVKAMEGVKAYVNGNRRSLASLGVLLESPSARAELKRACAEPDSKEGKKVLHKYMPHLVLRQKT